MESCQTNKQSLCQKNGIQNSGVRIHVVIRNHNPIGGDTASCRCLSSVVCATEGPVSVERRSSYGPKGQDNLAQGLPFWHLCGSHLPPSRFPKRAGENGRPYAPAGTGFVAVSGSTSAVSSPSPLGYYGGGNGIPNGIDEVERVPQRQNETRDYDCWTSKEEAPGKSSARWFVSRSSQSFPNRTRARPRPRIRIHFGWSGNIKEQEPSQTGLKLVPFPKGPKA
jgi:hypothetical protein